MTAHCPHCGFNLEQDQVIERDGFILDPRGAVSFHGEAITLPKNHVQLLYTLAASYGRPVRRDVLADRVGSESNNVSNTMSVIFGRIRKTLADAGAPWPVEVVWGRGYRWSL